MFSALFWHKMLLKSQIRRPRATLNLRSLVSVVSPGYVHKLLHHQNFHLWNRSNNQGTICFLCIHASGFVSVVKCFWWSNESHASWRNRVWLIRHFISSLSNIKWLYSVRRPESNNEDNYVEIAHRSPGSDGCVMPESRFLSLAIFVKCKYQTLFNKYSV